MYMFVCISSRSMKLRSMLVRNPGAGVLWSGVTGQVRAHSSVDYTVHRKYLTGENFGEPYR